MEEKSLTVAPFQCVWMKDFKFKEAGRGCVTFEACAPNDVTAVFRENVGTEHYHYKRDNASNYTVIIGSHRNKRLKIEANGETVVEVEGAVLCSSYFQSYWISVYDGLISVGTGRYPFQNVVFEWLDPNPIRSVQYVGLSSWDKHVGYKNVSVLSSQQNHMLMWKQVGSSEIKLKEDGKHEINEGLEGCKNWGLGDYLESWEFSDVKFVVGKEERVVPAHKIILQASGSFPFDSALIHLQNISYSLLHSLLQFIYTGKTQISPSQIDLLLELSLRFEVMELAKQCEDACERLKVNEFHFELTENVVLLCPISLSHCATTFPSGYPISPQRLKHFQSTKDFTDVEIFVEGHGPSNFAHKVILGLWSLPFAKMLTNGMNETLSSEVHLKDVSPEALKGMLDFMYSGQLEVNNTSQFGSLLLELLILSDRFSITSLYQECCRTLLECLSEDTVCAILLAVSSLPSCNLIEESCERIFATHFDFCTSASLEFVFLDEEIFTRIIKHQDLTATSEEKILNAILMWCAKAEEFLTWETIGISELLIEDRLLLSENLLPFVRFPLLPLHVLAKMAESGLGEAISIFNDLVKEAIDFVRGEMVDLEKEKNVRFQYRRSSYKQLQYICDGDNNGVLYFAGTSFGQHSWVNPVLAKIVKITSSSPISRYTDPKFLVSRAYQGTSFAGPKLEKDGSKSTWWMVDLGQEQHLMCNYYTLRQDGSRTYIRTWNLQGSMDGKTWTNLSAHENDDKICKPAQFASWPVSGPCALLPFRFFRVVMTGPTSDSTNPWSFCICYLELYGFLR